MNQATIDKVSSIFYETNFADKFAWPGLFKAQAYLFELKTDRFVKWFDSLRLPYANNIYINSVNSETDREVLYSGDDAKSINSWGELVSRSIAIPAFIDKRPHFDGGVGFNPPLYQFPNDGTPVFVSQLMMPYRTTPKGRIDSIFYSWEFSAFQKYQFAKQQIGDRLKTFYPNINDISSTDFGISKDKKKEMVAHAFKELELQFELYGIGKQEKPTPVYVALSGGGIRSGAHMAFFQHLLNRNFIPIAYSGTSGGAAFAVLVGGYAELLKDV